jgi:epoxide hydrolase A/B
MTGTIYRPRMPKAFPPGRRVATNGIHLAVHEAGTGPAVVLLHGFPELAFSWRHQIDPLVDAGFRVLAPDQRGFGSSDAPADPDGYRLRSLVADVTGLLDALEIDRAVWIGHDWGGSVAWHAGVFAPERVAGLASLCTPYSPPGSTDLAETLARTRGPDDYFVTFQRPGVAERLLERDVEATFRAVMRGHGPAPAGPSLPAGLFVGDPPLGGEELLDDEELAVYVEAFRRTGFTGGLRWYRAVRRNWEDAQGRVLAFDGPALMIGAADDPFLPPRLADGMEAYLPRLERHVVPDAGHWLQQERPDAVNALLLDWLGRQVKRSDGHGSALP